VVFPRSHGTVDAALALIERTKAAEYMPKAAAKHTPKATGTDYEVEAALKAWLPSVEALGLTQNEFPKIKVEGRWAQPGKPGTDTAPPSWAFLVYTLLAVSPTGILQQRQIYNLSVAWCTSLTINNNTLRHQLSCADEFRTEKKGGVDFWRLAFDHELPKKEEAAAAKNLCEATSSKKIRVPRHPAPKKGRHITKPLQSLSPPNTSNTNLQIHPGSRKRNRLTSSSDEDSGDDKKGNPGSQSSSCSKRARGEKSSFENLSMKKKGAWKEPPARGEPFRTAVKKSAPLQASLSVADRTQYGKEISVKKYQTDVLRWAGAQGPPSLRKELADSFEDKHDSSQKTREERELCKKMKDKNHYPSRMSHDKHMLVKMDLWEAWRGGLVEREVGGHSQFMLKPLEDFLLRFNGVGASFPESNVRGAVDKMV
jgi:hypothetical protein